MNILIPNSVRAAIAQHLIACYPREGCGALIGEQNGATIIIHEAVALPNRSEQPGDRFEIDPLAYSKLEQRLLGEGRKHSVVGFFHSHPDGPAQPSRIDLEMARGLFDATRFFYVHALQRLDAGGAGELTCWRLNTQCSGFDSITVAN